jgi:DNA-binding winged helix-turn-helix (wHTH) protein
MGTAIEMWRAYEKGLPILTISPLVENWVVRFLSTQVFTTLEEFRAFVEQGGLEALKNGALPGQLIIDLGTHRVTRGEKRVYLTKLEVDLLAYLARKAPRVVHYDELLQEVWGYSWNQGSYHAVKACVSRLRRKIEDDPLQPRYIMCVRGVGYRLRQIAPHTRCPSFRLL